MSFQQTVFGKLDIRMQKNKVVFHHLQKLTQRAKTTKLLEENRGRERHDIGPDDFLDTIPDTQAMTKNRWDYV